MKVDSEEAFAAFSYLQKNYLNKKTVRYCIERITNCIANFNLSNQAALLHFIELKSYSSPYFKSFFYFFFFFLTDGENTSLNV